MRGLSSFAVLGALAVAACAEPPMQPLSGSSAVSSRSSVTGDRTYVLVATGSSLPADLEAGMAAIGGTVVSRMDGIGVATVTSAEPDFATRASSLPGVQGVAEDATIEFLQPRVAGEQEAAAAKHVAGDAAVGATESFRALQWAPDAISAPAAWDMGYQGQGVRVAILDGGIHSAHVDIQPNLDVAHSASFVPGRAFNQDLGTFWHGTHVAGIVAAAANGIGTVGIAPRATLVGVKVLHGGSGAFSWIINGIYYAATPISQGGAGANIINMSLGAGFVSQGAGLALLQVAVSRATNYAVQRGTTVIAAAGNDGIDLDHSANVVFIPAQSSNVISVAATGPLGWAVPGNTFDLDRPASYTNFGQSAITFAAPGGDFALPGDALCSKPRLDSRKPIVNFCWVFDMVLSTSRGGATSTSSYSWAAGTSMASPAVAGVAALIIGKYGPISPAQVEAKLRESSDDLGKAGNDDFYGLGRVNAARAVQ